MQQSNLFVSSMTADHTEQVEIVIPIHHENYNEVLELKKAECNEWFKLCHLAMTFYFSATFKKTSKKPNNQNLV